MADHEDTSAALRRLEAALNRIAAQVTRPRPIAAIQPHPEGQDAPVAEAEAIPASPHEPARHEIVTKLDDLIGGLRSALGIERQP